MSSALIPEGPAHVAGESVVQRETNKSGSRKVFRVTSKSTAVLLLSTDEAYDLADALDAALEELERSAPVLRSV